MTDQEQVNHFSDALDALVNRHCREFDLTYFSVIGVLHLKLHELCQDSASAPDHDEKNDPSAP